MKPKNVSQIQWIIYNILFISEHVLGSRIYMQIFKNLERRLNETIIRYNQSNKEKEFQSLSVQASDGTEPFVDYYKPVVFKGAASNWDCVNQWNFDFFAQRYGDEEVTIISNKGLTEVDTSSTKNISFREYIHNLKSGSKDYLKFSRIVDEKGDLIKQFDIEWLRKFRHKYSTNDLFYFFMGGKGTKTPIHTAFAQTVFVQIYGRKKWTFYPTNNRLFIGVRPKRFNYFYSEIDISKIDKEKYPLYSLATPIEIILEPGDVLFFPSFIWHQVENLTDTIGVAYKFAEFKAGLKSSKMLTACLLLATKPPLIYTLFPWLPDTYNYKKTNLNKDRYKKI